MWKIKLKEHKWPGGEYTWQEWDFHLSLSDVKGWRFFPSHLPLRAWGESPTGAAEDSKEHKQTSTVHTVAVAMILLNTFRGWGFPGGERGTARNKGRDVKYQLQTISPDFLVPVLGENYAILKTACTVWF